MCHVSRGTKSECLVGREDTESRIKVVNSELRVCGIGNKHIYVSSTTKYVCSL
jgi:hypothetical protein